MSNRFVDMQKRAVEQAKNTEPKFVSLDASGMTMTPEEAVDTLEEIKLCFMQQMNETPLESREHKLAEVRYEAMSCAIWTMRFFVTGKL